jgi:hypothetical protein
MWAVIEKNTKQVIGILEPTATQKDINEALEKHDLVTMTLENSPASLYGYYIDGKFTPPLPNGGAGSKGTM